MMLTEAEMLSSCSLLCCSSLSEESFKGHFTKKQQIYKTKQIALALVGLVALNNPDLAVTLFSELLLADSMLFGLCRVTRALSLGREVAAEFFKCHCERRQHQGRAGNYPGAPDPLGFQRFTVWQLVCDNLMKENVFALMQPEVVRTLRFPLHFKLMLRVSSV